MVFCRSLIRPRIQTALAQDECWQATSHCCVFAAQLNQPPTRAVGSWKGSVSGNPCEKCTDRNGFGLFHGKTRWFNLNRDFLTTDVFWKHCLKGGRQRAGCYHLGCGQGRPQKEWQNRSNDIDFHAICTLHLLLEGDKNGSPFPQL